MSKLHAQTLSRRERQIMDIIYASGSGSASGGGGTSGGVTAKEIVAELPDPPSRTAVRTLLRILEDKGHVKHREEGREYVYLPTRSRQKEGRSALTRVVRTFFGGSLESALAAHLADPASALSSDDLSRLEQLIRDARAKGE